MKELLRYIYTRRVLQVITFFAAALFFSAATSVTVAAAPLKIGSVPVLTTASHANAMVPPPCNAGYGYLRDGNGDNLVFNGHNNPVTVSSSSGACVTLVNCVNHSSNTYCEIENQDGLCLEPGAYPTNPTEYAEGCVTGDASEEWGQFNCNTNAYCVYQNWNWLLNQTAEGGSGSQVKVAGGSRSAYNTWVQV